MTTRLVSQRGVALLLALTALSIVSVASVGIARHSSNRALDQRYSMVRLQDRLIIESIKPLLVDWAENQSSVLPEEEAERVGWMRILDEHRDQLQVRIERLDLSGRLHYSYLGSRVARRGLPPQMASLGPMIGSAVSEPELPPPLLEELLEDVGSASPAVFPQPDSGPAVCEWITTAGSGLLNVNACPVPLLEVALEGMDPALNRHILDLRRKGELIPARTIRSRSAHVRSEREFPALTVTSEAYGFLVTIEHASSRSRFWMVVQLDRDQRRASEWRLAECRRVRR